MHLMVLSHTHSFTGYILRFSRASYGLILPPLLHRIYFKVFPCVLSYSHSFTGYILRFPVHLMVLSHLHFFTGYRLRFPRASYVLISPHSFTGYRLRFPVLLMVLPHPHSFTGYILRFSRASYGLISSPLLYRMSFNVFPCFLWSYLTLTPSPDIV